MHFVLHSEAPSANVSEKKAVSVILGPALHRKRLR